MRYCSFKYPISENIGDEIQSLAAEQFLPRVDERLDRDSLSKVAGPDQRLVIMNGWFTKFAWHWPPAPHVVPVFFGFHITPNPNVVQSMLRSESIAYFQRFAPIGCRDRATRDLLGKAAVETFYSKCLTLTFPTRNKTPADGKVFLVDLPDFLRTKIPGSLAGGAVTVAHSVQDVYGESIKFAIARRLLTLYREQARLVITTRLHCAMPCLAMGIPVIFFGSQNEARVSISADVALRLHPFDAKATDIDWNPRPLDIEAEKSRIVTKLKEMLHNRLEAETGGRNRH